MALKIGCTPEMAILIGSMIIKEFLGYLIFLRPNKLMVSNPSYLATVFVWTSDSVILVSNCQLVFEAQNNWGV